jgi:hypothetical protein
MKTTLLILTASVAAFTSGWILKPAAAPPSGHGHQSHQVNVTPPAPREANPFRSALTSPAGSADRTIEPFRTVEDVISLVENLMGTDALDEMQEMAFLDMAEALPRLMLTDPATVRTILDQMAVAPPGNPEVRMLAAGMLAGRWILQEPEGATGYILANPALFSDKQSPSPGGPAPQFDETDPGSILAWFGVAMTARKNPEAAKKMISMLPEQTGGDLREMMNMLEARADPGTFLTTTPLETLEEMDDVTPILARWAKQDPHAALRWAQTLDEPDGDTWVAIAEGWADKDRAAATAWGSSLTDADHRRAVLGVIASRTVAGLDAAAVDAALAAFPPEVAAQARLEHLSSSDHLPAGAAAVVQDILTRYSSDHEIMEAAAGPAASVMQEFVSGENGRTEAISWLSNLPEGTAKSRAATTLIDQWAEDDATAASAWIKALPAGETREHATIQLISEITADDPAGAIEWAKSLSDEAQRKEQAHSIFKTWLQENPYEAMEALQQFPAGEQTAMFSK